MSNVVYGYDVIAANYPKRPSYGQIMLYGTGTANVAATDGMLAANTRAVIIDQSPMVSAADATADVFDVENAAVTLDDIPVLIRNAWDAYDIGDRPGQRKPAVYASAASIDDVTAALAKMHAPADTGLLVAHWGLSQATAAAMIDRKLNGFPVIGVQYASMPDYDVDVFSAGWLADVSARPVKPQVPPGQWRDAKEWTWKSAVIIGTGLDGHSYTFAYDTASGTWAKK